MEGMWLRKELTGNESKKEVVNESKNFRMEKVTNKRQLLLL